MCLDDRQEVAAVLFVVAGPDEQVRIFPDGRDSDGKSDEKDEKKNRQQKAAQGS